jgi:hypothetical protein
MRGWQLLAALKFESVCALVHARTALSGSLRECACVAGQHLAAFSRRAHCAAAAVDCHAAKSTPRSQLSQKRTASLWERNKVRDALILLLTYREEDIVAM